MLSLPPTVRVFVAVEPLDMRGSFDALAWAVRQLGLDPVNGHLYLFLNKRRRIAKALLFDGSGWCVLAKRLEAGSFQLPLLTGGERQVQVDGDQVPGVLAPNHQWRPRVVAKPRARPPGRSAGRWIDWATLLRNVFLMEVRVCSNRGGKRRPVQVVKEGHVARKILELLGLPTTVPRPTPFRPEPDLWGTGPPDDWTKVRLPPGTSAPPDAEASP